MKIEFDKALLWLLPYLYLVSAMYYWGFWGAFDIDAFNYYSVSDLVKGVIAPLGKTLLITGMMGVSIYFIGPLISAVALKTNNVLLLLGYSLLAIILAFLVYDNRIPRINLVSMNPGVYILDAEEQKAFKTFEGIILAMPIIGAVMINKKNILMRKNAVKFSVTLFILLFPTQSFLAGNVYSWRIRNNKSFDYLIADSLVTSKKNIYKYLGKAGEYHIMLTLDNTKKIIVQADKLTPLVIERFSIDDTASVHRFKAHQKDLAILVSHHILPKQLDSNSLSTQPTQPKQ